MVGVVCGETDPAVSHGKSSFCAMNCHPDKGALGIKKLEKFVPSKTSRRVDF